MNIPPTGSKRHYDNSAEQSQTKYARTLAESSDSRVCGRRARHSGSVSVICRRFWRNGYYSKSASSISFRTYLIRSHITKRRALSKESSFGQGKARTFPSSPKATRSSFFRHSTQQITTSTTPPSAEFLGDSLTRRLSTAF